MKTKILAISMALLACVMMVGDVMGMARIPPHSDQPKPRSGNADSFQIVCNDGNAFYIPSIDSLSEQEAKSIARMMANKLYFGESSDDSCSFMPITMTRFFQKPKPKLLKTPTPPAGPKSRPENPTPVAAPVTKK